MREIFPRRHIHAEAFCDCLRQMSRSSFAAGCVLCMCCGMKRDRAWTHAAACERATLCSQHNNKHALSAQNGRKLNLLPGVSTAGSAFPKVLHHLPAFFRLFSLVVEDNNTDSSDTTPPFINVACVKLAWLV